MLILALDTTTRAGSAALARDAAVIDVLVGDPDRTHGERLPGDLVTLLGRHGLTVRDVDLYAVACGPGSFTGLRVGVATVQGLALVHGRRVVPISALDALAALATGAPGSAPPFIVAWMDAQRGEVFAATYRRGEPCGTADGSGEATTPAGDAGAWRGLEEIVAPLVGPPARIIGQSTAPCGDRPITLVGDGALRYREIIIGHAGDRGRFIEPLPPLAPAIALLAHDRASRGDAVSPHAIRPVYVRRPDAELARDRAERAG